jgi:GT2 family glycosyltransferase
MNADPFVSFVFPVHQEGLPLLRRSVAALEHQTDQDFEVVVAVDAASADFPWACIDALDLPQVGKRLAVVPSPRTAHAGHLPHRNHARNAGCREAVGQHLWVLDADMLADPGAVEHLKAVASASQRPVCVSPCFAEPDVTPTEWASYAGDPWALPRHRKTASGLHHCYRPGAPATTHLFTLPEGFPSMPRWLWEALGGFDERYLGWGANKIDLCRRLRFLDVLEQLVEVHLLTSVLFLHQPHERDPLHFDEELRARNTAMFACMQEEAHAGAPWWREQVARVRAAVSAHAA